MAVYNTSILEGTSGPVGYTKAVNTLSGGILGLAVLGLFWIIGFSMGKRNGWDTEKSMILGFATSTFLGWLTWLLGLIRWEIIIIPLLLFIITFIIRIFGGE